jgi:streptogramin lyase
MTHPSRFANMAPVAKPPRFTLKRAWMIGIVLLVMPLGLLLIAELVIDSFVHQGWTTYKTNATALAVDQQGRMWAAVTKNGSGSLLLYPDNSTSIPVPMPNELASGSVLSLAIDRQNRIWVGTANGLIGMRESSGSWTIYTPEPSSNGNPNVVWDLVIDGQDRAWARRDTTLVQIDPQAANHIYNGGSSGLTDNHVDGIAVDKKGQLWAVSRSELIVLGPDNHWTNYATLPGGIENMPIDYVFAVDDQNQVWMGISPGVMVLNTNGVWQPYTLGDTKIPNLMKDMVIDDQGRVWAASAIQGLFTFESATGWVTYNQGNSGLASNNVTALALDGQGQVWIGTFQDGLSKLDPASTLPATQLQALATLRVVAIPATLLSMALVTILAIAFSRRGAISSWTLLDFSLAFVGWFMMNSLLWIFIRSTTSRFEFGNPLVVIPLPVNLVLLILVLLLKKRSMALGAFTAFLVNAIGTVLVTTVAVPLSPPAISGIACMFPFFLPFFLVVIASRYGSQKYPH